MPEQALVPFEVPAALLAEIAGLFPEGGNKDLTEGVQPSFAVVTFRGKVWRVRFKGEDKVVKSAAGEPVPSIIAVIVKSSPAISKLYYAKAYSEGDDVPPDCYSLDGVRPDPTAVNKQSPTCAACPNNVWGSRITESGSKAKACADNRRLAIVPYPDLKNELYGGPMLLRIPPTSLVELGRLGDALKQHGTPYQAVVVKIGFDYEMAYPKLTFQAVRPLNKEEALVIRDHMVSDQVLRMLVEPVEGDETKAADAPAQAPQRAVQAAPAAEVAEEAKPVQTRPTLVQATPAAEPEEGTSLGVPDEPKEKKVTPAKAAAAPAEVVNADLSNMITDLLK